MGGRQPAARPRPNWAPARIAGRSCGQYPESDRPDLYRRRLVLDVPIGVEAIGGTTSCLPRAATFDFQLREGSTLTRQAIARHLRPLEGAGIVDGVRSGRKSRFEFDPRPIERLGEFLDRVWAQVGSGAGEAEGVRRTINPDSVQSPVEPNAQSEDADSRSAGLS